MNRRDVLKRMLAVPALAIAAPAALAAPMLTEASLEDLLKQIADWARLTGKPIAIHPTTAHVLEHRWKPDTYICWECGATAEEIENGDAPKICPGYLGMDAGIFGFGEL